MSQHGSKLEEPLAFTSNNVFNTLTLQVDNEQEEKEFQDAILDNPDFYHPEQDTKLAQDLAYIDQTYYDHQEQRRPKAEYNEATSGPVTIPIRSSPSRRRQSQELHAEVLQEVIVDHRTMPTVAMDLIDEEKTKVYMY